MDEGEVTREMRDGTVSTESSSTVIGTAPPREIDANKVSELVSEGTLARFLYFYKHVGVTDTRDTIRQILAETSCDNDREHSISEQEQERLKQRLSATLAQIAEHYAGGIDFEVELTEQMLSRTVEQKITATLDRHAAGVQESIKPMLTRYTIHALRIACIMAALDKCSSKVQEKHLEQAMPYWGESFSSMLEYFADRQDEISGVNRQAMKRQRDKADDKLELLIRILQKPGIRQAKTVEELDSSRETIREHAKELEERDVIKIKRTGNSAKYLPKNNRDEDPLANYM